MVLKICCWHSCLVFCWFNEEWGSCYEMSYLLLRNSSGVHATWMNVSHFIVAVYSMLEKFQSNFFVHFFLCVNWLGLIAIFSNTSFSILVLNYLMLSVFVICPLSVMIFRNGKCAVYLNSRQVYLEKKFETKNIWKHADLNFWFCNSL